MDYPLHHDPRSSHQRIARLVRRLNAEPVLDVGAAAGNMGRLLAGSGLAIDAIEPAGDAAAACPFYRRVIDDGIEDAQLEAATYRVVICADVLEHTADPVAVVRSLVAAAAPNATFVISLPNIAHLWARAIVLAGRFPQHDRGPFDRTHLHFYTRQTALELLRDGGLRVDHIATTPVPLEDVWPSWAPRSLLEPAMRLQTLAARLMPTAFAYQWLFVAHST